MTKRYPRISRMLREQHSPSHAAEILLDAVRGQAWPRVWIRVLRSTTRGAR